jgi:hypothetical protein
MRIIAFISYLFNKVVIYNFAHVQRVNQAKEDALQKRRRKIRMTTMMILTMMMIYPLMRSWRKEWNGLKKTSVLLRSVNGQRERE